MCAGYSQRLSHDGIFHLVGRHDRALIVPAQTAFHEGEAEFSRVQARVADGEEDAIENSVLAELFEDRPVESTGGDCVDIREHVRRRVVPCETNLPSHIRAVGVVHVAGEVPTVSNEGCDCRPRVVKLVSRVGVRRAMETSAHEHASVRVAGQCEG